MHSAPQWFKLYCKERGETRGRDTHLFKFLRARWEKRGRAAPFIQTIEGIDRGMWPRYPKTGSISINAYLVLNTKNYSF